LCTCTRLFLLSHFLLPPSSQVIRVRIQYEFRNNYRRPKMINDIKVARYIEITIIMFLLLLFFFFFIRTLTPPLWRGNLYTRGFCRNRIKITQGRFVFPDSNIIQTQIFRSHSPRQITAVKTRVLITITTLYTLIYIIYTLPAWGFD